MKYVNTRNKSDVVMGSAHAIKKGLSDGGGLYMPEAIPKVELEFFGSLIPLSYPERAAKVLSLFLTDYSENELLEDALAAYSDEKFTPCPAPITKLSDGIYMLELWHGPTSAFKDMALQIMPRLFARSLGKCGEQREAMILVATSGDTGKAALEGYRDVKGTSIKVFYPIDGVSEVQKRQMQSQEGDNVSVVGIRGNFDDAQSGVKEIFSSEAIRDVLDGDGVFLSSANSINWGRLVPQVVYYISAYCDLVKCGALKMGDALDVTVPTGNFGNIFAAFIAKLMGLPIGKLVCASNKNDVLTDFFESGEYNKNREFFKTVSPSMDILISSNLERLIYTLFGRERCAECMNALSAVGEYRLTSDELTKVREHFIGYSTSEEECLAEVKKVYEKHRLLIDTHTAVATHAANRYMCENKSTVPMLVVSTASAYKFASDVYFALTGKRSLCDLKSPLMLEEYTKVTMPEPLRRVLSKDAIHKSVINKDEMAGEVIAFAKGRK